MPENCIYLIGLARVEAKVGNSDKAKAIYRRILALQPENEEAISYLRGQ